MMFKVRHIKLQSLCNGMRYDVIGFKWDGINFELGAHLGTLNGT